MKNLMKLVVLAAFSIIMVTAGCKKEETPVVETPASIVGTWTLGSANTVIELFTVNNKPFVDYLVSIGATQAQAQTEYNNLLAELNAAGTMEFKADGNYTSTTTGTAPESGKYKIVGTVLTMDAGTVDETIFNVITLTKNSLVISTTQTSAEDMNEDGTPDTMIMKFKVTMSR